MAELETLRVAMTADVSDFKQSLKEAGYSVEQLEEQLQRLNQDVDEALKIDSDGRTFGKNLLGDDYDDAMQNAKAEIEALKERIFELQNASSQSGVEGLKDSLKGLEGLNIAGELKKATKQIVKMGLAMVGIRSVYLGIRKSMSQYLSQNEELQNKLNACYYAIGSLLAPVLEKLVNGFVILVSYADAFVKALGFAGINMSNFGKSASSSAKSVNKLTAGFDELNNLSDNNSGSSSSIGNPFSEVELDNSKLETIKKFGEWCKENIGIVKTLLAELMLVWLALKTSMSLSMFAGLSLVILGIAQTIKGIIDYLDNPTWKNFGVILSGISLIVMGLALAFTSLPLAIAGAVVGIIAVLSYMHEEIDSFLGKIENALQTAIDWIKSKLSDNTYYIVGLVGDLVVNIITYVRNLVTMVKNTLSGLTTGIRQIVDGIIQIFKGNLKQGIQSALNGILTIVKTIFTSMWTFIKGQLNLIIGGIESAINSGIRGLNNLTSGLRGLGNGVLKLMGVTSFSFNSISTISLPRLATGTNYVPQDMVAQIHKGEAVVPKKFNEEQFNNSKETNDLLKTLIKVVDSKEFKTYISQSDIGKSAVNYINKQSRILGGNLV